MCCGDAFRFQNTGSLRSLYGARGERLASVSERRKCVKPGAASVLRHVAAPLGPAALGAGQHMRWSSLKDVIYLRRSRWENKIFYLKRHGTLTNEDDLRLARCQGRQLAGASEGDPGLVYHSAAGSASQGVEGTRMKMPQAPW